MTRQKQLAKALDLLRRPVDRRDECQHDIETALDRLEVAVQTARESKATGSKEGRRKLQNYLAALKREQATYERLGAGRPWFSPNPHLDRNVAMIESMLNSPSRPSGGSDASRKKAAVAEAHDLLKWWDRKVSRTRNGAWDQLATIFYGEQSVYLFDHLRGFKNGPLLIKLRDWIRASILPGSRTDIFSKTCSKGGCHRLRPFGVEDEYCHPGRSLADDPGVLRKRAAQRRHLLQA
jgi:hypothetical protein